YYEPWLPRAAVMPDGWFHTGDVGGLDAEGFLTLRGRIKDLINVMGMKFFPAEVEAVLAAHPSVAAACVHGERDGRFAAVPAPQVVRRRGAHPKGGARLLDYRQSRMASYKLPARIEIVDALPRTPSGKLLRRAPEVRPC